MDYQTLEMETIQTGIREHWERFLAKDLPELRAVVAKALAETPEG